MNELVEASKVLRLSLTRYMDACSAVTKAFDLSNRQEVESHSLLDYITQELQNLVGYEKDLRTSKSTLARYRNSAFAISPVNYLPCEVLAHIFALLSRSHSCLTHSRIDDNATEIRGEASNSLDYRFKRTMISGVVSQVCSHWRKVALSTQELWTHIDMVTSDQCCTNFLSRSKLFASRTLSPQLEVHITTSYYNSALSWSSTFPSELELFSASIAPRIGSFRLDDFSKNQEEFSDIINYFLRHITPGALTRLILLDHSSMVIGCILVIDPSGPEHETHDDQWVGKSPPPLWMSMKSLDDILNPVKVLWLRNRYFPWDSRAYSGLVDLRLLSHGSWSHLIRISELFGILKSCPELRIFHCELDVDCNIYDIEPEARIPLKDLEVLKLHNMTPDQSASVLAYLYPGTRPLSLSIDIGRQYVLRIQSLPPVLLNFFGRTNIERLFLSTHASIRVSIDVLFPALPFGLRTIGFKSIHLVERAGKPLHSDRVKVDNLILDHSAFDTAILRRIASVYSVRVLVVNSDHTPSLEQLQMDDELKQSIPVIRSNVKEYGINGNDWTSD